VRAGDSFRQALRGISRCSDRCRNDPGSKSYRGTGVGVPRGTPAAIIERLNREINAGLEDPGIEVRLAGIGGTPIVYTPDEMRATIARDTAKWTQTITRAAPKPE
jgi:tripartite-type tricarboxylate transporter receptor subunit TctC